jgi:hypothetical protein
MTDIPKMTPEEAEALKDAAKADIARGGTGEVGASETKPDLSHNRDDSKYAGDGDFTLGGFPSSSPAAAPAPPVDVPPAYPQHPQPPPVAPQPPQAMPQAQPYAPSQAPPVYLQPAAGMAPPPAPPGYGHQPAQPQPAAQHGYVATANYPDVPVEQLTPEQRNTQACYIIGHLFSMLRQKNVPLSAYMLSEANQFLAVCGFQRLS